MAPISGANRILWIMSLLSNQTCIWEYFNIVFINRKTTLSYQRSSRHLITVSESQILLVCDVLAFLVCWDMAFGKRFPALILPSADIPICSNSHYPNSPSNQIKNDAACVSWLMCPELGPYNAAHGIADKVHSVYNSLLGVSANIWGA